MNNGDGLLRTANGWAAAEKINSSFASRLLRLTLLAPGLVKAILEGQQPEGIILPVLVRQRPVD